jgi:hypothetical protein
MWPQTSILWIMLFNFEGAWAVWDTGPFFAKQVCDAKAQVYIKEREQHGLESVQFSCREYRLSE